MRDRPTLNTGRFTGRDPPLQAVSPLFAWRRVGDMRYEVGHGAAQDVQELTQRSAAVGGLLLQFRHHQRLLLAEEPNQERFRV